MQALYRDRRHAGCVLAGHLRDYASRNDVVVLALPRGGVPVAFEVSARLELPLDVFLVRKLGYPGQEELAMGAIASGGARVLNRQLAGTLPHEVLERVIQREQKELVRREQLYRKGRPALSLAGKTTILVDDGLATGATLLVTVRAVCTMRPARIVGAVPVASMRTCRQLADEVDEMVCAATPEHFESVGTWYRDFRQTSDAEVQALLSQSERMASRESKSGAGA